jgi:hypothetical protein
MHPKATTALAYPRTQEAAELFLRRAQLAHLRTQIAASEATLAQLRSQLHSFEGRYIRQVGVLYVQLDDWESRIAALEVAHESMEDTERLLRESQQPAAHKSTVAPPLSAPERVDAEMGDTNEPTNLALKFLFREVAKRIHPDFALNPDDALLRTHQMAQANDAFRRGDAALLLRMLHGHDLPARAAISTQQALAETLDLLQKSREDLAALASELETLTHSEMAGLRERTRLAALGGSDLLAEMAAQVKGRIGLAMRRYELTLGRIRRNQPTFNPEALLTQERPLR